MAHVSPEAFRAALRELSDEEFAAFAAAVFRARGRDARVESDGPAVVVDDRTLLVHRPGQLGWVARRRTPALGEADGVLTDAAGLDLDCDVVGPERLYEHALFGVDGAARAELFERLDVSPTVPDAGGGEPSPAIRRSHLIVAIAALALVVAALVGFPGGAQQGSGTNASGFDDRVTAFRAQGTPAATPTPNPTTTQTTQTPPSDRYPLGVGENGIESGRMLARTHARALSGTSYRLELTRREFVDGNRTGFRREVTYVAGPRRVFSTLNQSGRLRGTKLVTNDREVYTNGTVGYVRENGSTIWDVEIPPDQDDILVGYLGGVTTLLLPDNSSLGVAEFSRNGTDHFRIPFATRSTFDQRNVSGYAIVDEDGVVRDLQRRWELEDTNLTVDVRMRVQRRNVTIEPPGWVRAYRQRQATDTATNDTTTTTTDTATNDTTTTGSTPRSPLTRPGESGPPLVRATAGRDAGAVAGDGGWPGAVARGTLRDGPSVARPGDSR